ncbi:MAG: large conductance mechanosensitive channel protein MscL [Clostridiales bacterium]|nr:large conductance mechanosensitive channel protein MscL [Clostridiales bacterium]
MKKFVKEFKEFAVKGNVLDMAIGVIIGGAFGKIVSSLVADVIMPLIGLIPGAGSVSGMFAIIKNPNGVATEGLTTIEQAVEAGCTTLNYGTFIQTIIDFFFIALSIFLFVKAINKAKKAAEKPAAPAAPAAPTTKKCPFCCSEIAIEATRCPHCTSELPKE